MNFVRNKNYIVFLQSLNTSLSSSIFQTLPIGLWGLQKIIIFTLSEASFQGLQNQFHNVGYYPLGNLSPAPSHYPEYWNKRVVYGVCIKTLSPGFVYASIAVFTEVTTPGL